MNLITISRLDPSTMQMVVSSEWPYGAMSIEQASAIFEAALGGGLVVEQVDDLTFNASR